MVTPMGTDVEQVWQRLKNGESGVGYTTVFDASNPLDQNLGRSPRFRRGRSRRRHRSSGGRARPPHAASAIGAAKKAVRDSGIEEAKIDPTRFGVYLGSGEGQQDFHSFTRMMVGGTQRRSVRSWHCSTKAGLEELHPVAELEQEPNMPAGHLAGVRSTPRGPNSNCLTAYAAK